MKLQIIGFISIFISLFSCGKVVYLNSSKKIENVNIQPAEALQIAQPFLEKNATYLWRDENKMEVHIVKKGKFYYVMQTDYPAKTYNFYLQPAIRINSNSGKIKFIKK